MDHFYFEKTLIIGEKSLSFTDDITSCLEMDDGILVLIGFTQEWQRNVFSINFDGSIKWQIESIALSQDPKRFAPFTGIYYRKDKSIQAYNYEGHLWDIDPSNGKLLKYEVLR